MFRQTWPPVWDFFTSAGTRGGSASTMDNKIELTPFSDRYIRQLRATFTLYPDPVRKISGDVMKNPRTVKFEKQVPTSDAVALSSFARRVPSIPRFS